MYTLDMNTIIKIIFRNVGNININWKSLELCFLIIHFYGMNMWKNTFPSLTQLEGHQRKTLDWRLWLRYYHLRDKDAMIAINTDKEIGEREGRGGFCERGEQKRESQWKSEREGSKRVKADRPRAAEPRARERENIRYLETHTCFTHSHTLVLISKSY